MILISHRGNLKGPNPARENSIDYIHEALSSGFHVEIDVWYINGKYFLGHDNPDHEIEDIFLTDERLWCHAKNVDALCRMLEQNVHCFWHQSDDYAVTSRGHLWTYPGRVLTDNSVCVMPESYNSKLEQIKNCLAVCTDHVEKYKILLSKE